MLTSKQGTGTQPRSTASCHYCRRMMREEQRPLFTIAVLVSGVVGGLAVVIAVVYLYRFCLKKRPPVTTNGPHRAHSVELLQPDVSEEIRRASFDVPRGTGRQLPSTEGLETIYKPAVDLEEEACPSIYKTVAAILATGLHKSHHQLGRAAKELAEIEIVKLKRLEGRNF
ncbi:hypothetical protein TELCIR_08555 [Teladorsagia circumcincta]|uniref:Uncharacterized protein n=1 Tax=Teladorsagia circumcincta TaxID=45464 RepID=A0A2G9UHA7_TELCI|nr:hypothetical protein TELCIR_08555 [Teladorsagia circumcincta]